MSMEVPKMKQRAKLEPTEDLFLVDLERQRIIQTSTASEPSSTTSQGVSSSSGDKEQSGPA